MTPHPSQLGRGREPGGSDKSSDALDGNRLDLDTTRTADGEERRKAIGLIGGKLYTVVYTLRGSVCRLIAARRFNAKESRSYGDHPQNP